MSAGNRRKSKFDYPNSFIVIWVVAMFVSFGVIADLIDPYGTLYNLGQGLLIALFVGVALLLVRWLASRRQQMFRT